MLKKLFLLIFLSILCVANEKVVRVATLEDYAPFCKVQGKHKSFQIVRLGDDAKNFAGYSWDILRESYQAMGYTIELFISPWVRSYKAFNDGKFDIIFPTGKNSQREKVFDYSKSSVNHANFVIYVNKNSKVRWNGLSSIYGKTIGVKSAYNYGDEWAKEDKINKENVVYMLQGFKMLKAKRFDGFLGYEYNCDLILKENGMENDFKKLAIIGSSDEYLVALKSNKRGKKLLKDFDEGKKKLEKSGRLKEIEKKWFVK